LRSRFGRDRGRPEIWILRLDDLCISLERGCGRYPHRVSTTGASPGSRRAQPLGRRHVERRDLNTRRLLPAVERLLEDFTYPELSVDQMVAEADISRSTFYNYFEDKNDLLRALTADAMGAITDATRRWWSLPPQASRDDLRLALQYLYESYAPHAALMRAVSESLPHDPGVRAAFTDYMRNGAEGIAGHIRAGQQAGVLRPDLDAAQAAEWLVWMFERGLSQLRPSVRDPERVVDAVTDIVWKGLR
jgi:AcrR family transcriptional regulator